MPLNPQKVRLFTSFFCPRKAICPRFVHEKNIRGQIYVYLYKEETLFLHRLRFCQACRSKPTIYPQPFCFLVRSYRSLCLCSKVLINFRIVDAIPLQKQLQPLHRYLHASDSPCLAVLGKFLYRVLHHSSCG